MKKPYKGTIICSSGRDCVLIILFQLEDSKADLFEGDLLRVGQYDPPNLHAGRTVQFLSNLSKIIQNTADIILQMQTSLAFL